MRITERQRDQHQMLRSLADTAVSLSDQPSYVVLNFIAVWRFAFSLHQLDARLKRKDFFDFLEVGGSLISL